jgi:hypothetical protein
MKKILIGLLLFGSFSALALTEEEARQCPRPTIEVGTMLKKNLDKLKVLTYEYKQEKFKYPLLEMLDNASSCEELIESTINFYESIGKILDELDESLSFSLDFELKKKLRQ